MKIKSKSSTRHESMSRTREKCDLLTILLNLGVIIDVKMRGHSSITKGTSWYLTIEAEVRGEE